MAEFTRRAALAFAAAALLRPRGASAANAHDFAFRAIEGGTLPLASYRGRPVLVVNTASQCGFTKQYAGLQELWKRYRERGLVVLG
ncbi:MAG: redoxin domain-containing protein, partial [Alphaproteobacteria bacterium]|nr:redoxin domain-containing protein [Alphaproteobacteria bacterium]